jgi:uncharacterized protein (TIGR02246 family)
MAILETPNLALADLNQTIDRWADAINRADTPAIAALFSEDAIFIGSHPKPLVSRPLIEDYYRNIPVGLVAQATVFEARRAGPSLIVGVIDVTFRVPAKDDRKGLISIALRHQEQGWLIELYHLQWV